MTTQTDLARALLDPAAEVPAALRDGADRPAGRRFSVYRNNVAASLSDALEVAFPAVRAQVGAEFFRAMAGAYLRAHPPSSPLMMFYGAEMPGFLASFPPVARYPWLPDLARLELALRESYHAADADPLPPGAVAGLAPETLAATRLRVAPAIRLVRSDHPVHGLWASMRQAAPKPRRIPQAALVTRPGHDPRPHPLSPAAGALAAALIDGTPLGEAAALAPDDLAPLLQLLLSERAIIALD